MSAINAKFRKFFNRMKRHSSNDSHDINDQCLYRGEDSVINGSLYSQDTISIPDRVPYRPSSMCNAESMKNMFSPVSGTTSTHIYVPELDEYKDVTVKRNMTILRTRHDLLRHLRNHSSGSYCSLYTVSSEEKSSPPSGILPELPFTSNECNQDQTALFSDSESQASIITCSTLFSISISEFISETCSLSSLSSSSNSDDDVMSLVLGWYYGNE